MGDTITQEIIQVVEIAERGLTGAPGLPVDILATAPASPTEGYTYYNTTDHKLWYWNGTAWVDVTASADASTLQGQNGAYYLSRDNHTGPSGSKTTPVNADNVVLLDSAASGIAKNLTWANTKASLKTYFDTVYEAIGGGSLGVGDSITGLTQGSVLFGGSGGTLAQNNAALKWTDNTQFLVKTTSESVFGGAMRLEFDGWDGSNYTTGLTIRSTNAVAYYPFHIRLENGAYGTSLDIALGGEALDFVSSGPAWMRLWADYGHTERLIVNAVESTSTPIVSKLAASQTADSFQVRNSSDAVIAGRNAAGECFQTLRTPASASATGVQGTIVWDASYIYICTATDTWKRVAIATW